NYHPLPVVLAKGEGVFVWDVEGKKYYDFLSAYSAVNQGHCHPKIVAAVQEQTQQYMHVMVYGEYVQKPAVTYTKLLASVLPKSLETTYLVNSGTEAMEGALKLARRVTGRTEFIAAHNAYHGNTMGSLSIMGYEERKSAFRPLIPHVSFIHFNKEIELEKITERTAAVILETIQGGAGFIEPEKGYLKNVRERCTKVGALLILDEIQPGFGRTGKLFAFEHYNCIPDILVMGKGMASGLPVGAFTASKAMMDLLQDNPKLGHITTFGGNPVIAAACLATLKEITESNLILETLEKEKLIRKLLKHTHIQEIRGRGLMLALILKNKKITDYLILTCMQRNLILFWLLFQPKAVRITPPLTISREEIKKGCAIIINVLDDYVQ
ncbi:MAG: aspartate aminotransferase family protein, partial [Bacteroidota bacterium]